MIQRLTIPVNCGMLKKKRRPAPDASQKNHNDTMGKTEEPIGSRRELEPPYGLRRRDDRPHNRINPCTQDVLYRTLFLSSSPFLRLSCVYEGKALCVAISGCLHGVFLFFSEACQRGPYPSLTAEGTYTFTHTERGRYGQNNLFQNIPEE